ncbi:MAG: hypothetical protein ACMX3H_03355 [Sodalis sp. (in: enterobacteria)]|uniref:hypothetical protein n=1 Tax=Sodalis sp. (in: enterobacteria) TaxID=1898979 RepID=UPI0039E5B3A8
MGITKKHIDNNTYLCFSNKFTSAFANTKDIIAGFSNLNNGGAIILRNGRVIVVSADEFDINELLKTMENDAQPEQSCSSLGDSDRPFVYAGHLNRKDLIFWMRETLRALEDEPALVDSVKGHYEDATLCQGTLDYQRAIISERIKGVN